MKTEFARGPFRARLVMDGTGNPVVRLEGPTNQSKGRVGMTMSPNVVKALAEWLAHSAGENNER